VIKLWWGGGGIAASGVFYIGCPRCARVEGLLFFLPNVVLYHTVSNLQTSKADHLPPSIAEVKKGGTIPPLPHMSSWHSV
jgi:hypothetical protein